MKGPKATDTLGCITVQVRNLSNQAYSDLVITWLSRRHPSHTTTVFWVQGASCQIIKNYPPSCLWLHFLRDFKMKKGIIVKNTTIEYRSFIPRCHQNQLDIISPCTFHPLAGNGNRQVLLVQSRCRAKMDLI